MEKRLEGDVGAGGVELQKGATERFVLSVSNGDIGRY